MSILIYAESAEGKLKKSVIELATYAHKIAEQTKTTVVAVAINTKDVSELGNYGVNKVLQVSDNKLSAFLAKPFAEIIVQAAKQEEAELVLFASSINSGYISPLVAIGLNAGLATNVVSLPESFSPFRVKRYVFSCKAYSITEIQTAVKVLSIIKKSYGEERNVVEMNEEVFEPMLNESLFGTEIVSVTKNTGKISIHDADIVVSGGMGMKGPENWGILEELADALEAAIACTKPVTELGWRPHTEHVGQTGIRVSANMYVAVGISGAIQHVSGINSSRIKLVINNDPEAPFFKVADYGILGDAFEILPKLTEKIKDLKAK